MKRYLTFSYLLIISSLVMAQSTNSWVPNGNGSWMTTGNWSLGHVPLPAEKVLIDKNKSLVISDVPAASITGLTVANVASKTVTLEAGIPGNILTITGGPGLDLDLTDHNVVLNLTGGLDLVMGPGTSGEMEKTFSGRKVTFMPTSVFTISGNGTPSFTASNLRMRSAQEGFSALVVSSASIPIFTITDTATVEQYLTGSQWHYISSPVEGATSEVFLNDYLRYYDEPAGDWSPFIVPTDPPLGDAVGYEAWTNESGKKIFHGTLHSGDYTVDVTRSWIPGWSPADTNGWNLVGNPYPSAVDWQSDNLILNHIDPTIYYWNGSSYVTYNRITNLGSGSRYIPPMQAFFVHVTRDSHQWTSGTVKFTNASRVNTNVPFYKDAPIVEDLFTLRADGNGYSDMTMISFNDTASEQFDWQLDNLKLSGNADVPELYSELSDGTRISVNSLPWAGISTVVPLSFNCGAAGTFTVTAGGLESFDPAVSIVLRDLLANSTLDLRADSVYSFTHDPQFNRHRFEIEFFNPSVGDNSELPAGKGNSSVYTRPDEIIVMQSQFGSTSGQLVVFDMLGREVFRASLKNDATASYSVNLPTGYYVASVISSESVVNQKIHLP